ncbi:AAA family ATPase [Spirulina sp. 06S082]|uniref:AAA family ATPase n=1 Tax=Spirulina sp. 06S082 TaxID=3110248 RepID=UPI002B1FE015|nr:AAA family ATPase [Spirulina sp. 06S082]MEA5467710.1 AAA family ATPase [Spirulina sp. 06S082]
MKIRKLELQNFKCFEQKTFEFSDRFNVLIGDNATGKTAILDALAIGLGSFFLGIDNISSRGIRANEIRQIVRTEGETSTRESILPVIISCHGCFENNNEILWTRERKTYKGVTTSIEAKSITTYASELQKKVRFEEQNRDEIILPIISYYGTGRLWIQKQKKHETLSPGSRFRGYKDCLTNSHELQKIIKWFKTWELASLQKGKPLNTLSGVKKAIENCMEDWKDVRYDVLNDEFVVTAKDGRTLPFYMLSDGVRNMIGIVADISYRCVTLNPQLEAEAAKYTPGIVLIDEIDLHLHPKWQRRIIENLNNTFPNIQFVVTTHSPFIIQSLQNHDKLINLNSSSPSEYEGRSIEDIVEDIMGIELPQYSRRKLKMFNAAEEYYKVLEEAENIKEYNQQELERLKQKLDEVSMPFSDNPAYHAFLKMERLARGIY